MTFEKYFEIKEKAEEIMELEMIISELESEEDIKLSSYGGFTHYINKDEKEILLSHYKKQLEKAQRKFEAM